MTIDETNIDECGSNEERRNLLREHGWTPAVGETLLTKIAHWKDTDGRSYTEERAAAIVQARREKAAP